MPRAKHPRTRLPFWSVFAMASLKGQHETYRFANAAFENTANPITFLGVVQLIVLWIDVYRELSLFQHVRHRILVSSNDAIRIHRQATRKFFREFLGLGLTETVISIRIGYPLRVVPQRQSVSSPITTECPTRQ